MNNVAKLYAGAAVVGVGLLWWLASRASSSGAAGVGQGIGGALVSGANGLIEGAVTGAGAIVGIPRTDPNKCAADRAAGRWWDASYSCPASTYLGNIAPAAIETIGASVGIPRTSASKCEQDMARGDWWDASFSCPAGTFLGGITGLGGSAGTYTDAWGAETRQNRNLEQARQGGASSSY
jgi:hypothetical protein